MDKQTKGNKMKTEKDNLQWPAVKLVYTCKSQKPGKFDVQMCVLPKVQTCPGWEKDLGGEKGQAFLQDFLREEMGVETDGEISIMVPPRIN